MKKKQIIIFLLIIFLMLFFGFFNLKAQDSDNLKDSTLTEAETYKLLYENMKETNSRILNTIYWALALILGSNLIYTYKFNKREGEKLKENIKNSIENLEEKSIRKTNEKFNEFANETKKNLEENIEYHFKTQQKEIDMIKENLESKMEINFDYIKKTNEQEKELNEKLFELIDDLNKKNNDLKKNLIQKINKKHKKNKIEITSLKADFMKKNDNYDGALMYYTSKLQHEIELGINCEFTLNEIIRVLEKIEKIPDYSNEDLNKILKIIPGEYKAQKTKISNLIEKKL